MSLDFTIGMAAGIFIGNTAMYYFLFKIGFWQSIGVGILAVVICVLLSFGVNYFFK